MFKGRKKAYMTVEASLVYPVVFGGILFMLYLGFYLYNITVVSQMAYIAALRGSQKQQFSDAEIEKYVENQLEQLIDDRLFFVSDVQKEIKVMEKKIKVKTGIKTKTPATGLMFIDRDWDDLEYACEAVRVNPVKIIRNVRKLYED